MNLLNKLYEAVKLIIRGASLLSICSLVVSIIIMLIYGNANFWNYREVYYTFIWFVIFVSLWTSFLSVVWLVSKIIYAGLNKIPVLIFIKRDGILSLILIITLLVFITLRFTL